MHDLTDKEFYLFQHYLLTNYGLDIPIEKKYLLKTRLQSLINQESCNSFQNLYLNLKNDKSGQLQKHVIEYMTTNETSFFRDDHPFTTMLEHILPQIIIGKSKENLQLTPTISVWSAACSTGQEPYSIAIVIKELSEKHPEISSMKVRILATDISNQVLSVAEKGIYSNKEINNGLSLYYRNKYCTNNNDSWSINEEIRSMIDFQELNLSTNFIEKVGKFDIILCRNAIIYFSSELKKTTIKQFSVVLNLGGVLMLGASENLYSLPVNFKSENFKNTLFYRVVK